MKKVPAPRLVCVELNPGPAPLSKDTRRKIIWYKEDAGISIHEICRKTGVTRPNIRAVLKKYKESKSVKNRPGQGRKRKLDSNQDKIVVKKAKSKEHERSIEVSPLTLLSYISTRTSSFRKYRQNDLLFYFFGEMDPLVKVTL